MITASWRSVQVAAGLTLLASPAIAQFDAIQSAPATLQAASGVAAFGGNVVDNDHPSPPAQQASEDLDVVTMLAKVAAAYAEAATHERVAIKFAGPDGHERFDQMQVSLDPGRAGGAGRRLAVSMGSLRVQVVEGLVTAVSESAVGRVFRAVLGEDLSSTSISKVLPPLPIPALEFLGGRGATAPQSMTPYANGVVWDPHAERTRGIGAGQSWAVIHGSAGDTRVALTVDLATWRIRHVEILGRQGAGNWTLDCSMTPIAAPASDPFAPLAGSLQPVASLAELVAAQLPLEIGARVPSMTLMDSELHPWSVSQALARDVQHPADSDRMLALVLYRSGTDAARADAQAATLAVTQTSRRIHADVTVRPVMVCELGEFKVVGMEREASEWDASVQPLVSTGGRELLDRFAPGQNVAIVLIGADHKLRAMIECDGRSSDTASIAARLQDAIRTP